MEEAVPGAAAEETLATPLPVRDEDDLLWESSEKGSRQWGGGVSRTGRERAFASGPTRSVLDERGGAQVRQSREPGGGSGSVAHSKS